MIARALALLEATPTDRVLVVDAIQSWPDPLGALRALHRLLRPGGRLVLVYRSIPVPPVTGAPGGCVAARTDAEILALLGDSGFEALAMEFGSAVDREQVCIVARRTSHDGRPGARGEIDG